MTPQRSPADQSPPQWDADAFREAVQTNLDAFLDEQGRRLAPLGEDAARLVEQARRSVRGGKRLRAAFCFWGHHAVPPGVPVDTPLAAQQPLLDAGAALELLHASALVHDDYVDASDTRRGQPAAHKAFERRHREQGWRGDPEQYGAAGAILLGDLLLSWAEERLRTSGGDPAAVRDALACFDTTRSEVITGQFLDVSLQARGDTDVEQAMRVLRYKSAKYSVERPLHLGARLAGADEAVLQALSDFGLPLGEAFQLRDDLLGVFGDPEVTGKPAGDDLSEGKRTVLVALAVQHAPAADARFLDERLGTQLSEPEVARLRAVIEDCGAHAEVESRIWSLTDQAHRALAAAPITEAARAVLAELATAATQRVV